MVEPYGRSATPTVQILQMISGAYRPPRAKNFNAAGWQQQFLVV